MTRGGSLAVPVRGARARSIFGICPILIRRSGHPRRSARRRLLPQPTQRADNRAGGPTKLGCRTDTNITDEMRSGRDQRPRGRFNANRPFNPQPRNPQNNQTFDSNGPNIKIRGSAHQIFERYLALAREATASDDRIAAENFYQHAEHYFRTDNARREGNQQGMSPRPTTPADVEMNADADSKEVDVDRFEPQWEGEDSNPIAFFYGALKLAASWAPVRSVNE